MLSIKERDFSSFFNVPFEVYEPELGYVSLLKTDLKKFLSTKNPLFNSTEDFTYFTAFRNNKPIGRIVAHIHHASNEKFNLKRSYFGFFDCADDPEAAKLLLDKAEEFGKKHNCTEIAGNFNLTAMQQMGVLVKAQKKFHYTDQVYGPEYLPTLLENCGYNGIFPMTTFEFTLENLSEESLLHEKQKHILNSDEYELRNVTKKNFKKEFESIRHCLNDGFANNPMFVPLSKEEMDFQAADMMLIIDEYLTFVTYKNNRPQGTIICIPDPNSFLKNIKSKFGLSLPYYFFKHKLKNDRATIIFYSVCHEAHGQGINTAMLYKLIRNLKSRGYKKMGITWIADENKASLRMVEKLGANKLHDLKIFRKDL
jgi:RimJ/RimL family protein N-acetyltransferase